MLVIVLGIDLIVKMCKTQTDNCGILSVVYIPIFMLAWNAVQIYCFLNAKKKGSDDTKKIRQMCVRSIKLRNSTRSHSRVTD